MFETKLRDWHLQKDPNFRWCAHVSTCIIQSNCMHCKICKGLVVTSSNKKHKKALLSLSLNTTIQFYSLLDPLLIQVNM